MVVIESDHVIDVMYLSALIMWSDW